MSNNNQQIGATVNLNDYLKSHGQCHEEYLTLNFNQTNSSQHHHLHNQVQLVQDPDYDGDATLVNPPSHELAVRLYEVNQVVTKTIVVMALVLYEILQSNNFYTGGG